MQPAQYHGATQAHRSTHGCTKDEWHVSAGLWKTVEKVLLVPRACEHSSAPLRRGIRNEHHSTGQWHIREGISRIVKLESIGSLARKAHPARQSSNPVSRAPPQGKLNRNIAPRSTGCLAGPHTGKRAARVPTR
jgi:hypothetical protein